MVLDYTHRRIGENSDKYPAQDHFLKLRMSCLDGKRNCRLIAEMRSRLALWAHRFLLDCSYQLQTCVICSTCIVSSLRQCRVIPETFIINDPDSNFPPFTVSDGLLLRLKEFAIGVYDEPFKSTYLTLSNLHNSNILAVTRSEKCKVLIQNGERIFLTAVNYCHVVVLAVILNFLTDI